MERITEIFVLLENKPNSLGKLCEDLAKHDINIEALGVFVDSAKLYVKDTKKTLNVLEKLNYQTETRDVLIVTLENKPGELAYVTSKLGHVGINIDYCFGSVSPDQNFVTVILDVDNIDVALSLLK